MREDFSGGKNVLVAESDADSGNLISSVLMRNGYAVTSTWSGTNAIRILKRDCPDFVILDTALPGIDGIEICKWIKNDEAHKDIPVVLLSDLKDLESRLKGYLAGADRYVCKPYGVYELLSLVEFFCGKEDEPVCERQKEMMDACV